MEGIFHQSRFSYTTESSLGDGKGKRNATFILRGLYIHRIESWGSSGTSHHLGEKTG